MIEIAYHRYDVAQIILNICSTSARKVFQYRALYYSAWICPPFKSLSVHTRYIFESYAKVTRLAIPLLRWLGTYYGARYACIVSALSFVCCK